MPDDAPLSDEALARIGAVIGDQSSHALLQTIAYGYLEFKRRADTSAGRGLKTDLRRLAKDVRGTAQALANVDLQIPVFIAVANVTVSAERPNRWVREVGSIGSSLERLADAIDNTLQVLPRRTQLSDLPMDVTLGLLEMCFRKATGKRATHTSHKNGEYVGQPLSHFGQFCVAFFAELDPKLTPRAVANGLEKRLWKREPGSRKA